MVSHKLRRVFACTVLMSALSLLPAEAASRQPRQASFSARIEHWGAVAWSFLTGLWEKRDSNMDPNGFRVTSESGGH